MSSNEPHQLPTRWDVFRDIVIFQVKLLADGLRDIVLSPLSILAALYDLIKPGNDHGRSFYAVLRWGRKTEDWINVFEAADRLEHGRDHAEGVDAWLNDVEKLLREPERRRALPQTVLRRLEDLAAEMRQDKKVK